MSESLGSDADIDSDKDIHAAALRCLREADIDEKLRLARSLPDLLDASLRFGGGLAGGSRQALESLRSPDPSLPRTGSGMAAVSRNMDGARDTGHLPAAIAEVRCHTVEAIADDSAPTTPRVVEGDCVAGRPDLPRLVPPAMLPRRGLGSRDGRAAFIHAIAHIEFNAINLACDAVYRFRGLPLRYYRDWLAVAAEEAKHFGLLQRRLADFDHAYGDFDAHNGLWEMAEKTAHSCLERMALVPRVLEARGLDVTPGMIERLQREGDDDTVAILNVILREEVAHVAAGTRWYQWCCDAEGIDAVSHFRHLLARFAPNALRGPLNEEARQRAGFAPEELLPLEPLS